MASDRITRDELFMATAKLFALRSTCLRAKVGAVIVFDRHIISHGYAGAPAGMPQCIEVGCDVPEHPVEIAKRVIMQPGDEVYLNNEAYFARAAYERFERAMRPHFEWELGCQRTIHAEANAVAWAGRLGVSCNGATMYSTHEPCRKCAELIIQAGIAEVHWEKPYRLGAAQLLNAAHVRSYGPQGGVSS